MKGAILSTGYNSNHVEVKVDIDDSEVVIRPNNLLSRALGSVSERGDLADNRTLSMLCYGYS